MPRKQKGKGKGKKPKPKAKPKAQKKANHKNSKKPNTDSNNTNDNTNKNDNPNQNDNPHDNNGAVETSDMTSTLAATTKGGTGTDNNNDGNNNSGETDEKKQASDLTDMLMRRKPRRWQVDKDATHPFWDDQPVPSMKAKIKEDINEPIEVKTLADVRKEPLKLPNDYYWYDLDLTDDSELTELYNLLYNHYVEDDDNMFRFNYSKKFLQWALLVPGYLKQWHLGVRFKPNALSNQRKGKLCACITAIPALVNIREKQVKMVEINFLCVYKSLRAKRLAPVLIKEITRRVNCQNIWQAVYTAGVVIPKPVASNRYWHRSLNPKKLIDIGFSSLRNRMTMPRLLRLYRVDKETKTSGLREMRLEDCEQCWKLLINYFKQFELTIEFSLEEFKHLILPREDVIYSYVVCNKREKSQKQNNSDDSSDKTNNNDNDNDNDNDDSNKNNNKDANDSINDSSEEIITDFFSYYNLSSSVINNPRHSTLKAAYGYYNVSTKTPLKELMADGLVLAHKQGFDVFNSLDVMENSQFLKDLKFGIGDGRLQYYMYNWQCAELKPGEVGIVLL